MRVSKALPYLLSLDASSTSVYCNAGFPAQDQSAEGQITNSELILMGENINTLLVLKYMLICCSTSPQPDLLKSVQWIHYSTRQREM